MLQARKLILIFLSVTLISTNFSYANFMEEALELIKTGQLTQPAKDKLLGNLLTSRLESTHFSKKKVNDESSVEAFKLYLEKLDYRKRFLLKSDVEQLKKYEKDIDDQMKSGNLILNTVASNILRERIKQVEKTTAELLKKPFDFSKEESLELDPDKKDFVTTEAELKDLWRKVLKLDTLNRISDLQDEQEGKKKDKEDEKNDSKKKVAKKKENKTKLTFAQMEEKARKETAKSYHRVFERMLKEDHYDEVSKLLNAMAMTFDPHTIYMPPREKENFNIDIKGSLEGIGALLREDGDYIKVVEIIPGSASWKQGDLKADDVILKVGQSKEDPIDIVGMRVEEAVQHIRGKKGTEVRLTVKKGDGTIITIPITRDTVVIEETYVKSAIINKKDGKKFGYILVPKFYRDFSKSVDDADARNVTSDVKAEITRFNKLNVDGVILDLRNNGGGSLEDARQMSGLFIEKGPIVQVKYSNDKMDSLDDYDSTVEYGGPLVVLQNSYSASASEIVAGALQDYDRAIVIGGEKSHGKGTVQTLIELDQGILRLAGKDESLGSLKITISKFYRISGGSTQYKGIVPDVILPDPLSFTDSGESSLDHSLPWDEVKAVKFKKWANNKYDKETIKKRSEKRVEGNSKFKKINQSIALLKKRKDETAVQLHYQKNRDEIEQYKAETEKLKYDEELTSLFDVDFNHIQEFQSIKDQKLKEEKEKKQDKFAKELKADPYIEESVNILLDMKNGVKDGWFSKIFK